MNTILEILDERDPYENLHLLALGTIGHLRCGDCGHIHNDWDDRMHMPCPTCGVMCECREVFFANGEHCLLEAIFECYLSKGSRQVCIALFCAMLEQHLEKFLVSRCRRLDIDWKKISDLLKKNWLVGSRLQLFEKLCGCSPQDALAGTNVSHCFSEYRKLSATRNRIVHGKPNIGYMVNDEEVRTAVKLATDSFSAFTFLHNTYCSVNAVLLSTELLDEVLLVRAAIETVPKRSERLRPSQTEILRCAQNDK